MTQSGSPGVCLPDGGWLCDFLWDENKEGWLLNRFRLANLRGKYGRG